MTETAPPNSPPADSPCRIRSSVRSHGAAAPIEAYVGSRPIIAVAPVIRQTTRTSAGRRPTRSPSRPNTAAPTGRKKKARANDAYALTSPSTSLPPSGVKNWAAMTVAK